MTTPAPFHVLIIEDSPDDRADLRQMLLRGSERHYKFTEAETGTAGIRAVLDSLDSPPDCVLLDYNLPDMDALAVLAALHAGGELTVCPVVVVTVSLDRGTQALRAGAQEFLGKSWTMPESVTRAIDSAGERHVASRMRLANEAALRQNTALFYKIIEQAPGGVYVVDSQFRVAQMNAESLPFFAAAAPLIGRDFDEALGIVWGPEIGPQVATIFRHTLATGERYVSPRFSEVRHDLGVEQSFEWETQRITLPDGQHGVVCYFQDVTARERAAEALRVSEERYRSLVTASSAVVYRMSADWSEMHQLNGQGFVADTTAPSVNWVEEYLYPEDQPQVLAVIREAIRTKGHFEMEHRIWRVDGSVGWTSSHAIPLLNAKGEIIEWFGAARDITARKQAEQARHEMERNYQALADASSEIAYRMSADWSTMLPLNGRQLVLSTDKPLANWDWLEQNIPREEHPRVRQAISDAIAGKTLFELEHRVRRPDGSIGWTLSRAMPFLNENGEVTTWFGAAGDITERKATEEALRESEERLRKAISIENVGVLFFKLDGRMIDANGALERMTGYTADELRTITDWAQLTPPEFMDITRRAAAELAERGVTAPYEKQWIRKDGSRFWGLVSSTRLSGSGSESECVKFIIDITETKRAEEQVRRHRHLLETIVDHLPAAVALIRGSDFTFQMVNPAFQAISPGKQLVGKTIWEAWPETMPFIALSCRRVLETGEPFNEVDERYEIRRASDGPLETAYFSWSIRKVNLPDEVQPGLLITIWETTAHKEVELALSEKSERYKALFDSINQGFCIIEVLFEGNRAKDYRFLEVNPAFEKHTGLKEVQGKSMREMVPDHDEHWFEMYGKIALTGEPTRFEQHAQALGRWFDVCAFRVGAPEQRRVAVLFSDITERRKAHEAVARLAAIFECSYDALLSEDLDGIVTSWNRGAEQIFGYSAEEIIGTPILRLIPAAGHAAEHELQRKILAGKRGGTFESIRQAKDGREFNASITVSPMTDAAGKIIGTSRVIRDITERTLAADRIREAKEAAEAANRSKDRFLAALSHELRTPLTPVLLVSEVRAKSKKLPKDLREDFEMIHRNIVLEAQLIDDLLDVSRIQQGKMRFDFKPVNVHEAIARALEMLRHEVEEKEMVVRLELGATPATLEADPARLRQVLCNLLRNSVKFTPRGGTITLHTVRDQSALHITITDTGAGIAAEDLERIFHPFEQVDAQQTSEHRSLGLGLAISAAIVAAHRGRIWAESPGPGQGSTLHVRLPF